MSGSDKAKLPLLLDIDVFNARRNEIDKLVLVDLGKPERFELEHIPGAKLVTPADTQAGAPIPGLIPSKAALQKLLKKLGINQDSHVVVYDDEGGGWAGRFIWILDELGHQEYSYLDGGLTAWKAAQMETEAGKPEEHDSSNITVQVLHNNTVDLNGLRGMVEENTLSIWDARSFQEYTGERCNAARGGHIPGAVHYEWTRAMDQNNALRLRPLDELKSELAAIGIDGSKTIVTHCQSHHRSGLTYLIGKLLGMDIKAYAGSWGEWGNQSDTPIITGDSPF